MSERLHCIEFGSMLRALREQRGLSRAKLAARIGVHYSYISYLERGKRCPSIRVVRLLCAALGLSLREREQFVAAAGFVVASTSQGQSD